MTVTTGGPASLTIASIAMSGTLAVLQSSSGAGIVVQSGTLQGAIKNTATATIDVTASVAPSTTLDVGTATGLTLTGVLTVDGTANVLGGVTVAGSTLLGNGGSGTVALNGCIVNSGAGSIEASVISMCPSQCCSLLRTSDGIPLLL